MNRSRLVVAVVLVTAGLALLAVAGWLVAPALGLAVAGGGLAAAGLLAVRVA